MATMLNFIEVDSSPPRNDEIPLTAPAKAVHRAPHHPDSIELRSLPRSNVSAPDATTPASEKDLEMSRPATPVLDEAVEAVPSVWDPYMNRFRLAALCLAALVGGMGDSAAGALIPYMEVHYDIGYAVVSLIFVGQALGFIFAAALLDTMRTKLGCAKLLFLAQTLTTLGYIPVVATGPFIAVVCGFFFVGFGIAIYVALGNIFCGGLQQGTIILGLLHGTYGIGGTIGPLVATALVTVANTVWSRYYIITLVLIALTALMSLWSFWGYENEHSPRLRQELERPQGNVMLSMLSALKLRVVLLGALFIFCYQGAEVSISGWVISFLITARGGDPSSVGYVTAGFWAGITIGRLVLTIPAHRIGEKRFVYGLTIGALLFQVLVWTIPNIVTNAVAVSIVGLMLGPLYPLSAAVFMRCMTRREALSGIGTISACGSLGGAVAPFITGLLAQAVGTWVLHPIVIFLFVIMLLCWWGVPYEDKKRSE